MERPCLSVIVPIFNEEEVLEALYQRLTGIAAELGETYEFVFVNDGSRDRIRAARAEGASWRALGAIPLLILLPREAHKRQETLVLASLAPRSSPPYNEVNSYT
ncbi:putative glycosyltransferase YkoT [compost metagenome]